MRVAMGLATTALLTTMAPARGDDTPSTDAIRAALKDAGIAAVRTLYAPVTLPMGTMVSFDFQPRQIAPDLCLYKAGNAILHPGPHGLKVGTASQVMEAVFASCDTVGDNTQQRIVMGEDGLIAQDDLLFTAGVLRKIVGVDAVDDTVSIAYETPILQPLLAAQTLAKVAEIDAKPGKPILAYVAPYSGDLIGLRIDRRTDGLTRVYVFDQVAQLGD